MPFSKVLVCVDSDPVAVHAAQVGVALAKALGGQIALISVIDRTTSEVAAPETPRDELVAEAREHTRQVMAEWMQRLAPDVAAETFTPEGHPAEAIVATAKAWSADLIVIGSHGRGALGRVLLGSVAEAVTHHAPCPVLVVRGQG